MSDKLQMIVKPFSVGADDITAKHICGIIDGLANVPVYFRASDLVRYVPGNSYHFAQEVLDRLFQRWRKLGLMEFRTGRWKLTAGAWAVLQMASQGVARGDA